MPLFCRPYLSYLLVMVASGGAEFRMLPVLCCSCKISYTTRLRKTHLAEALTWGSKRVSSHFPRYWDSSLRSLSPSPERFPPLLILR